MSLIPCIGTSSCKLVTQTAKSVRSVSSEIALARGIKRAFKIDYNKLPYVQRGPKAILNKILDSKPLLRLRTSKLFQKFVNNKSVKFVADDFGSSSAAIQKGLYEAGKEEGIIRKGTAVWNELDVKENPQRITTFAGLVSPLPFGSVAGYVLGASYKFLREFLAK